MLLVNHHFSSMKQLKVLHSDCCGGYVPAPLIAPLPLEGYVISYKRSSFTAHVEHFNRYYRRFIRRGAVADFGACRNGNTGELYSEMFGPKDIKVC